MKTIQVTVLQSALKQALSTVARAASTRSALPVLECVLLSQTSDGLRLSATNLEIGITCRIGARFDEATLFDNTATPQDLIALPAKTLTDLVNTLPDGDVQITCDVEAKSAQVCCGGSKSKLKGVDPQEFPPLPTQASERALTFTLPTDIQKMIQQVVVAASTDESRPILTGVSLTVQDATLMLAAADGFRLAQRQSNLAAPVARAASVIIPAPAMKELARIAKDVAEITAIVEYNRAIFQAGDITLISQVIEGAYPNLTQIIPTCFTTRTVVSTAEFLKACKQAEIFSRTDHYITLLEINGGEIKVGGTSKETGATTASLQAQSDGNPISIAFNAVFLKQGIESVCTPTFALETTAETSPGVIRPCGDDAPGFVYVAMPMHRDVTDVDQAASVAAAVVAEPA